MKINTIRFSPTPEETKPRTHFHLITPLTIHSPQNSCSTPHLQLSGFSTFLKSLPRYLFVAFGCMHLAGGPYSLVQGYAWANMLVEYSKETGFSQAVTDTFSGEKPCCLCKKIAEAKAVESKHAPQNAPLAPLVSKSLEHLFPPTVCKVVAPNHSAFSHPGYLPVGKPMSLLGSGPPPPPPRC